ncbi:Membrane-bound lytic murein transglycosylase D precursor [Moraxella ovis]|uniref:Membrane-bound lytic murein transglycosylase D n=2 Tax=Moraxella ovis TaxID=29433 RepID=A0A378QCF0_9GAMM|nr:Membrane-bound lytic murein transglycosylase D precursor [Moraxella ovis]
MARKIYQEMGVSPDLVPILLAQLHAESGWNPSAVSPAQAQGLSQFIPSSARRFGVKYGTSDAAVRTQIQGQVKYMNYLLGFFNGNLNHALSAYNWGEGNMQKHLQGKRQMPAETRSYVPKIKRLSGYYR